MKPQLFRKLGLAMLLSVAGLIDASAHTTSLGYVAGANVGEVTFWAGHYLHGGVTHTEGTGLLVGVDNAYSSGVTSFVLGVESSRPLGLIDGTNNFFWDANYQFGTGTNPNLFGGVMEWEGLTITGLSAGTYDFTIADDGRTTAQWANLTEVGGQPGSVRITLTEQDVSGSVPEPGSLALLGIGLLGWCTARKRGVKRHS